MPLPFILAGVAIAAAGYGVKKGIDALDADCEADEFIKKAESLKEKAKRKVDNVQSSRNQALVRLGKKKLHVLSHTASNFLDHFHRLKGHEFVINNMGMQNIQEQVSEVPSVVNKCKEMGLSDLASLGGVGVAVGVLATYGAYTGISMVAAGSMALIGGVGAAPVIAILGAISADEMEKKRDDAKAYCSQVEVAVKKADVMVDQFQAVEKMADLFIEQITRFEKLFFSLSIDAITTMKKCNYDYDSYNRENEDQLSVTVSTLMTLSAFLKVSIMDKHQKLTEKAKNALILMRDQVNAIESAQESGHYNVAMIQSKRKGLENL
ncbi:sortase [Helicobacter pylori]|uniref:sortase n=1 Tax=Helicobacter pylori TaxID=210 RepID=UPI00123817A7|nr:sortase [Helicobacter pylori]KAA6500483.1 sortase [Helicobacter pylori]KAA6503929.1 sortase [Helicobacter pylori]KAA6516792.1 sortase [Helicobacter pylori]